MMKLVFKPRSVGLQILLRATSPSCLTLKIKWSTLARIFCSACHAYWQLLVLNVDAKSNVLWCEKKFKASPKIGSCHSFLKKSSVTSLLTRSNSSSLAWNPKHYREGDKIPNSCCLFLFQEWSSGWKEKNCPTVLELEPKVGEKMAEEHDSVGRASSSPPLTGARDSKGAQLVPWLLFLFHRPYQMWEPQRMGWAKVLVSKREITLDSVDYIPTVVRGAPVTS